MAMETIYEENEENESKLDNSNNDDTDVYNYELPALIDISKYKRVAMLYCAKMNWKHPQETVQALQKKGYRATVSFGKPNQEISVTAQGNKKEHTIYRAYIKLIPQIIPQTDLLQLSTKYLLNKKNKTRESQSSHGDHPKTVILAWAKKYSMQMPIVHFSEFVHENDNNNSTMWSADVMFCGKTCNATATNKKDAEHKCFAQLLKLGIDVNLINEYKQNMRKEQTKKNDDDDAPVGFPHDESLIDQLLQQNMALNMALKSKSSDFETKYLESNALHKNEIDKHEKKWLESQKSHKHEIAEYDAKWLVSQKSHKNEMDKHEKKWSVSQKSHKHEIAEYDAKWLESQKSHKNEMDKQDKKWLESQKSHKDAIDDYEIQIKSQSDAHESDLDKIEKLNAQIMQQNQKIAQQKQLLSTINTEINQLNETSKLKENNAELMQRYKKLSESNQTSPSTPTPTSNKHKLLIKQHNALKMAFNELEVKYEEQRVQFSQSYQDWTTTDVVNWIIKLSPQKYEKYRKTLTQNIENEEIDGSCLSSLDKNDLYRIGITSFKDKENILKNIKKLLQNEGGNDGNDSLTK